MTQFIHWPSTSSGIQTYPNFAAFPASAADGALAEALDTNNLYAFNVGLGMWVLIASPGSTLTIGTIDSQTASANGAVISGGALVMQSASATRPGLVNNTTQTMSGAKTFSTSVKSPILLSNTSNPASAGALRLAVSDLIEWRNNANDGNLTLSVNASDFLAFSNKIAYSPLMPAYWASPAPDNIEDAIDRLAQIVSNYGAVPIPGNFSPSDIPNMLFWYNAENIIGLNNGDPLTTWPDASGNAFDLNPYTDPTKPTYGANALNGLPVVDFSPPSFMQIAGSIIDPTLKHTFFVVSKINSTADQGVFGNVNTAGTLLRYRNNGGTLQYRAVFPITDFNASVAAGNYAYITVVQDCTNSVSGAITIRENGVTLGTGSSGNQTSPDGNFAVGNYEASNNGGQLNGSIAEVIAYVGVLTPTQISLVEGYLAQRYAL